MVTVTVYLKIFVVSFELVMEFCLIPPLLYSFVAKYLGDNLQNNNVITVTILS